MKRTSTARLWKRWATFVTAHWRLVIFLLLFLSGFVIGFLSYMSEPTVWQARLSYYVTADRSDEGWLALGGFACLTRWGTLTVLLAAAVSVYGLAVVAVVPLVYGGFIGLSQCLWYATGVGGIWAALWQVVLPSAVQTAVILMACAESARMTTALAGQLLPATTRGSLWPYWRLCMLRFLLFFGLSTVSALMETTARMCF